MAAGATAAIVLGLSFAMILGPSAGQSVGDALLA